MAEVKGYLEQRMPAWRAEQVCACLGIQGVIARP